MSKSEAGYGNGRELVHGRTFHAPRDLVWKAWAEREHIERWWGPNGFSTTTHEMRFEEGGRWSFVMHGPDGVDYPNEITYEVIDPPRRIVYSQGGGKEGVPVQFRTTVSFIEHAGDTEVTMHLVFATSELREKAVKVYRAEEGGRQTLARLGEHLATMT